VRVSFRLAEDAGEVCRSWTEVSLESLGRAAPWRSFRWRDGQRHFSGSYWSATDGGPVIYESRLELARLLFADFAPSVRRIVAQPFLLQARVDGQERRHVPDYLLVTDEGPVVVDVKPADRLERPAVAFTFAWTRTAVEARGWRYEVSSESPRTELDNVRFLAGYRRWWLFDQDLLAELRAAHLDGRRLGEAIAMINRPEPLVRSALLHLLWRQVYCVDLTRPLSSGHILGRGR
jgi:hypothetical protein